MRVWAWGVGPGFLCGWRVKSPRLLLSGFSFLGDLLLDSGRAARLSLPFLDQGRVGLQAGVLHSKWLVLQYTWMMGWLVLKDIKIIMSPNKNGGCNCCYLINSHLSECQRHSLLYIRPLFVLLFQDVAGEQGCLRDDVVLLKLNRK